MYRKKQQQSSKQRCGRCHQYAGHNKRTCRSVVNLQRYPIVLYHHEEMETEKVEDNERKQLAQDQGVSIS